MKTISNKDEISIGRQYGLEILEVIKNAKNSIKIVSPYLSPSYLKELVKLQKRGISITLITSDELETNQYSDFAHKDVIKQKKIINQELQQEKKKLKRTSIAFVLIGLITLFLSIFFSFIIFLSIILFIISIFTAIISYFKEEYSYQYYPIFRIKIFDSHSGDKPWSTNLIHSKIFIIDEKICFLGSANFTYSAFKTHYETIVKIEDEKAIKDIDKEVEKLFYSTELKAKSVEEWGREVYE